MLLAVIILCLVLLKNIDKVGGLFSDNELVISFLRNLSNLKIMLPIEMIFVFFALFLLNSFIFYNKKVILIIISVVLFLLCLVVLLMLSKYGDNYVYQIILNLKESFS